MSEPDREAENILQRWSRRKQAAAAARERGQEPPSEAAKSETGAPPGSATPSDPPAFDPATLPPIESITATSDIRAFLAPGVPVELSRAALRRAWASDPAIRDFIGLAENQWNFTEPDSVPGFGSLEWTPELRQMLARLVGDAPNGPQQPPNPQASTQIAEAAVELPPPAPPAVDDAREVQPVVQPNNDAATQTGQDHHTGERPARRRHGGAMPR
jgi:Protein of unknown function (DUF3306)